MQEILMLLLLTAILLSITVAIHGFGIMFWRRCLAKRFFDADGTMRERKALAAITSTAFVLMVLHLLQIMVWAIAYRLLLPGDALKTFEEAFYFSAVTFTTLGYGDISLAEPGWRLLSGIEALNGILLVGWTTAFLFLVVQRSWTAPAREHGGA